LRYSQCRPRDLHSFPTRRSSDLQPEAGHNLRVVHAVFVRCYYLIAPLRIELVELGLFELRVEEPVLRHAALAVLEYWRGRRAGVDRKSTRLNSSHEWISYAVFCF